MLIIMLISSACGQKSPLEKASSEFDNGNFREAIFVARHHFRKGGQRSPELLFVEGRSLLALGREAEADNSFAEIYSIDSTWAPAIAEIFQSEAISSLERGLGARGRRFVIRASNYERNLDFGSYNSRAGKMLLDRKDYEGAIYYFENYLATSSDSAGAAEVMMDLGSAYEGREEKLKAIDLYRMFQARYPKSRLVSTAKWKLENLLLNAGKELYSGGETEEAENLLLELSATARNPLIQEKVDFMLAEIFESRHEVARAIEYYSKVVHMNLGSSGRMVEKAKERIVALEKAR
ncbi:MAG: tetratricopeptide repeat protein [Candidatus Krumholzibacteria bacterium]|nr:tetratricopeptide repeat protein [Candidatus Krumholzibacteria bacterium]